MVGKTFLLFVCALMAQSYALDWMHFYDKGSTDDWLIGGLAIDQNENVWACGTAGIFFLSSDNIDNCKAQYVKVRNGNFRYILHHEYNNEMWLFGYDTLFIFSTDNIYVPRQTMTFTDWPHVKRAIVGNDGSVYASSNDNSLLLFNGNTKDVSILQYPYEHQIYPEYVDNSGTIWFFGQGVYAYNGVSWSHFNKNNSGLIGERFHMEGNKFMEDEEGNIIVATTDEGLFIYQNQVWERFGIPFPNDELKNAISIIRDNDGAVWMSYNENCGLLSKYQQRQWLVFGETDTTRAYEHICNPIGRMVVDDYNRLWFATRHRGIFMINQESSLSCMPKENIKLIFPNANADIDAEINSKVVWETCGYIPQINVEYRSEEGGWKSLTGRANGIENVSSMNWYTHDSLIGRWQIRVFSTKDSSIADTTGFFTITADGQNLPPILQNIPDSLEAKSEETTTWTAQATDPEGDPVTFTFSELPSWATVSESTLTLDPTRNDSSATVRVIAADNNGGADTADLYIVVSHATTTEWGVGVTGPSANMLHVGKKKINLPAGKIKRVTLFNVQGKMIATVDTKNEHTNLLRIMKNITDSFVIAKIQYADNTSIQRTICLME